MNHTEAARVMAAAADIVAALPDWLPAFHWQVDIDEWTGARLRIFLSGLRADRADVVDRWAGEVGATTTSTTTGVGSVLHQAELTGDKLTVVVTAVLDDLAAAVTA